MMNYDISVSGDWTSETQRMSKKKKLCVFLNLNPHPLTPPTLTPLLFSLRLLHIQV